MHTLNDVVDGLESVIDYEADKKAKDYFIDYMVGKDWSKDDINKSITRLSELMDDARKGDIELVIFYMFMALVEGGKIKFDMSIGTDTDDEDGYHFDIADNSFCEIEQNKASLLFKTDGGDVFINLIKDWEFK